MISIKSSQGKIHHSIDQLTLQYDNPNAYATSSKSEEIHTHHQHNHIYHSSIYLRDFSSNRIINPITKHDYDKLIRHQYLKTDYQKDTVLLQDPLSISSFTNHSSVTNSDTRDNQITRPNGSSITDDNVPNNNHTQVTNMSPYTSSANHNHDKQNHQYNNTVNHTHDRYSTILHSMDYSVSHDSINHQPADQTIDPQNSTSLPQSDHLSSNRHGMDNLLDIQKIELKSKFFRKSVIRGTNVLSRPNSENKYNYKKEKFHTNYQDSYDSNKGLCNLF